jgi:hypothetical protein
VVNNVEVRIEGNNDRKQTEKERNINRTRSFDVRHVAWLQVVSSGFFLLQRAQSLVVVLTMVSLLTPLPTPLFKSIIFSSVILPLTHFILVPDSISASFELWPSRVSSSSFCMLWPSKFLFFPLQCCITFLLPYVIYPSCIVLKGSFRFPDTHLNALNSQQLALLLYLAITPNNRSLSNIQHYCFFPSPYDLSSAPLIPLIVFLDMASFTCPSKQAACPFTTWPC